MGELITIKQWYQHKGRESELVGHYSDAMCCYWLGRLRKGWELHCWDVGTRAYNSQRHLRAELSIDFSRSAHKYITKLSKCTSYKYIVDPYEHSYKLNTYTKPNLFTKNVKIVSEAFLFAGLTDSQRREAHLYRCFALFHYAKYLGCFPREVGSAGHQRYGMTVLGSGNPASANLSWNGSRINTIYRLYIKASSELFYAQQIDPSYDLLAGLDDDDRAICRIVQKQPVPQVARIEEHSVLLLGIWRGDAAIWKGLTKAERVLLKLLRQRCEGVSDGETVDEQELEEEYSAIGITWHNDFDYGDLVLGP
ncbi:hypothetical protein PG984_003549 [Apiospora sp. TS-2023a]